MRGPVLKGKRVTLRPHKRRDAKAFVKFLSDYDVTRYLARQEVPTLEEELAWIAIQAADPNAFSWTVVVDDKPVGVIGLNKINWRDGIAHVGTFIGDKSLWSQGIGTEMGQLVADFAFLQLPLRKIHSAYLAPNKASGKLQASAGLKKAGRWKKECFRDGKWQDIIVTECMRKDWKKARAKR